MSVLLKQKSARYRVPNLERGLKILELLLDYPQGLQQSEMASQLHFAKSSVYRLTMTLMDYGYLTREEDTKTIRLSHKLLAMGSRLLTEEDLMAISVDVLKQLRDEIKETVLIGTIIETELVVLGQALGSHPFKFSLDLGARLPLHSSAPSKAILAFLPADEQNAILRKMTFTPFNDRTICETSVFAKELAQTVLKGYAVDKGEQLRGIHCVAAPIFNRHRYPIAALWTTGPTDRLREEDIPAVGAQVIEHARSISRRLGYGLLDSKQCKPTEMASSNEQIN